MDTGYRLKFERALHHLNDLAAKTNDWFGAERYSVVHELDPERSYERRIRVILNERLPLDPFSLIIGDALHNLRSGLDGLAFALADGNGTGKKFAHSSEFPIFGNQNRKGEPVDGAVVHASEIAKRIAGISQPAQAIIKGLQPYHRKDRFQDDPLWLLHSLGNIDKHRSIHTVASSFGGMALRPDHCENFEAKWDYWSYSGPLEAETVVVRYTPLPIDPKREVKVDLNPIVGIGFADGPVTGQDAALVLATIYGHIMNNVVEPLSSAGGTDAATYRATDHCS